MHTLVTRLESLVDRYSAWIGRNPIWGIASLMTGVTWGIIALLMLGIAAFSDPAPAQSRPNQPDNVVADASVLDPTTIPATDTATASSTASPSATMTPRPIATTTPIPPLVLVNSVDELNGVMKAYVVGIDAQSYDQWLQTASTVAVEAKKIDINLPGTLNLFVGLPGEVDGDENQVRFEGNDLNVRFDGIMVRWWLSDVTQEELTLYQNEQLKSPMIALTVWGMTYPED